MKTLYLAVCTVCTPSTPAPFGKADQRDRWIRQHQTTTGHDVLSGTEYRPFEGRR